IGHFAIGGSATKALTVLEVVETLVVVSGGQMMRLVGLTVENFRCYSAPVTVRFGNLTALVGRNDVGKSTLMDALAIFFETASPDKDDACKAGDPKQMRITCEFDQLPEQLVVDAEFPT